MKKVKEEAAEEANGFLPNQTSPKCSVGTNFYKNDHSVKLGLGPQGIFIIYGR